MTYPMKKKPYCVFALKLLDTARHFMNDNNFILINAYFLKRHFDNNFHFCKNRKII